MRTKLILLFTLSFILQSCETERKTSPEKYFGKAALNTNHLSRFGAVDFEHYLSAKSVNSLHVKRGEGDYVMQDKIEPYLTTFIIPKTEEELDYIKNLKVTEDTRPMLEASINLYEFVIKRYKTDYIPIAKLIDQNTSETKVNEAITNLEELYLDKFRDLHTKLMDVAIPYAEANGIKVSRY